VMASSSAVTFVIAHDRLASTDQTTPVTNVRTKGSIIISFPFLAYRYYITRSYIATAKITVVD